jgi:type II pantothenate kinase
MDASIETQNSLRQRLGLANSRRFSVDKEHEASAIDDAIHKPGAVKINVKGAFITDEGSITPQAVEEGGAVHETKDIRLPHHKSVVSHVAVDVKLSHSFMACC